MADTTACWSCAETIDAADRYCRHCGSGQGAWVAWYLRPVWIVVLTILALGPFALYLVWRTPRLGARGKVLMGAFVVVAGGLIAVVTWRASLEVVRALSTLA